MDFFYLNYNFKVKWLRNCLLKSDSICFFIPYNIFKKVGGLRILLLCDYSVNTLPVALSNFHQQALKGIVHFEIKIWYLSAYPKGIQDVGVFFSSVDPILMFLDQTVLVCQSYNGRYRSLSL